MLGKKVLNHYYWHCSLTTSQDSVVRERVAQAEALANVQADKDYNIIKYPSNGQYMSLLSYTDFLDFSFPALAYSYRVDLLTGRVEKRNYHTSFNPPILHRKELMLSADHPRQAEYRELTQAAEQLGLFDNPVTIGFQKNWETLIAASGFQLLNGQFVALGNQVDGDAADPIETATVSRHLTALSRNNLSAPMQCLARHGFLDGSLSVFDYGCGRGDDIRNLSVNQINVSGWDPHYAPDNPKYPADIVNLGFVINVIEDIQERIEALAGAYHLSQRLLVVSAMLVNQNAYKGQTFNDGVLTQRGTFQKYFNQTELKGFLEDVLDREAIPVAPGIFYVFKDADAEQRFLLGRQRSTRNLFMPKRVLRLSARPMMPGAPKISRSEQRHQLHQILIEPLWQQALMLGRLPEKNEIANPLALTEAFASVNKSLRYLLEHAEPPLLEQARQNRINDLLTYFALQAFSRRKPYKHLDNTLQNDIKAFFGDYPQAISQAQAELFQLGKSERITVACQQAAEQGLGHLDMEAALHVHSSQVNDLPVPLRIYIGCATVLYGDVEQADLLKIHSQSGKLSLMRYDDFVGQPLPRLLERVKINLREQTFDLYQYGEDYEPTYLYFKSRFINEESTNYAEQAYFDEQIQALGLFDFSGYGPKPNEFRETLANARWAIDGFHLVRSQTIPDIDSPCGRYLSYRQLLECGETQHATGLANLPKQPDSYTALYELATHILDPVIDYFGMIRLTYGFCSHELGKHIKHRVAPKLDQHAAHEHNSKGNLICPRLGAAADFIVEDENMREVANWMAANTPFDRLYFYGEDRPLHVSFGPELKGDYIEMVVTESGRLVPKKNFKLIMPENK
ncbi:DNA phosphorothioation-associated putative methyltransferase [Methylovulum sp.]|uniref:DNA phosphorothioation-associated putative methyltransferase n=1 Tax=Methylovulum sp. TaxID=1916980 RepID=UPI002608FD93|nr:DNA phosphorothioation-associated putative methyltransferase [Methylovulum sp.]MDD5126009.1 DNA phosphorothioation-associated putative methyltransferase [Methylovulum sp.]